MATNQTFSVRLPPDTKRELEEYAQSVNRSRAFVVKEAVDSLLAERRAYLAAIEEAEREIERSETVDGEEVIEWLKSWGKPNELPPPSIRKGRRAA